MASFHLLLHLSRPTPALKVSIKRQHPPYTTSLPSSHPSHPFLSFKDSSLVNEAPAAITVVIQYDTDPVQCCQIVEPASPFSIAAFISLLGIVV